MFSLSYRIMRIKSGILTGTLLLLLPLVVLASEEYIVKATVLNVRSGPGTEYNVVFQLRQGEIINLVNTQNSNWYKIETDTGTGFVAARYVTPITDNGNLPLNNFQLMGLIIGVTTILLIFLLRGNALKNFGGFIVLSISLFHILFGWWGSAFIAIIGIDFTVDGELFMVTSVLNFILFWIIAILSVIGFFKNVGVAIILLSVISLILYVLPGSILGIILTSLALLGGVLVTIGYSQIRKKYRLKQTAIN